MNCRICGSDYTTGPPATYNADIDEELVKVIICATCGEISLGETENGIEVIREPDLDELVLIHRAFAPYLQYWAQQRATKPPTKE